MDKTESLEYVWKEVSFPSEVGAELYRRAMAHFGLDHTNNTIGSNDSKRQQFNIPRYPQGWPIPLHPLPPLDSINEPLSSIVTISSQIDASASSDEEIPIIRHAHRPVRAPLPSQHHSTPAFTKVPSVLGSPTLTSPATPPVTVSGTATTASSMDIMRLSSRESKLSARRHIKETAVRVREKVPRSSAVYDIDDDITVTRMTSTSPSSPPPSPSSRSRGSGRTRKGRTASVVGTSSLTPSTPPKRVDGHATASAVLPVNVPNNIVSSKDETSKPSFWSALFGSSALSSFVIPMASSTTPTRTLLRHTSSSSSSLFNNESHRRTLFTWTAVHSPASSSSSSSSSGSGNSRRRGSIDKTLNDTNNNTNNNNNNNNNSNSSSSSSSKGGTTISMPGPSAPLPFMMGSDLSRLMTNTNL
jgi:hypothetical protein